MQGFEEEGAAFVRESVLPRTLLQVQRQDLWGDQIRQFWGSVSVPEDPQLLGPAQRVEAVAPASASTASGGVRVRRAAGEASEAGSGERRAARALD